MCIGLGYIKLINVNGHFIIHIFLRPLEVVPVPGHPYFSQEGLNNTISYRCYLFSHRHYHSGFFLCSILIIMSHITVTTSAPLAAVVSFASTTTMTVVMAPNSMDLAAVLAHGVVLSPPLILRDTMMGSVGLTTVPQQQQAQFQIPS